MDARLDWIWMQAALGPGSPRSDSLLRAFGRPSALREARGQGLEPFGLSQTQRQRLADPDLTEAEAILKRAKELGIWLLTPEDALYPSLLRGIPGLPLVLYGLGSMPDLEQRIRSAGDRLDCRGPGAGRGGADRRRSARDRDVGPRGRA